MGGTSEAGACGGALLTSVRVTAQGAHALGLEVSHDCQVMMMVATSSKTGTSGRSVTRAHSR